MRRGRVHLGAPLDLDEPQPRAFEQLVPGGRRRCREKPSHQLAQLYRSFFVSHRLTSLVAPGPLVSRPQSVERARYRKLAFLGLSPSSRPACSEPRGHPGSETAWPPLC